MQTVTIEIDILSYWHIGTGRGRGREADALTLKDGDGLPYLPGRALKGLYREAVQTAEDFGQVTAGTATQLFGLDRNHEAEQSSGGQQTPPGINDDASAPAAPGVLCFSNATLPPEVHQWFRAQGHEGKRQLYRLIPATALDDGGLARDHSLRLVEVCLPLRLTATVCSAADDNWQATLQKTAGLVRALGVRRRRGYGRCRLTIISSGRNRHV